MPDPTSPAAWHPDPFGRFELRFWDGASWTEHVSSQGRQAVDAPVAAAGPAAERASAGWFPDPHGRHELRYWDGERWTDHVTSREQPSPASALPASPGPPAPSGPPNTKVQRQVRSAGASTADGAGSGTAFTEPVLVINQRARPLATGVSYSVYDQHGRRLGEFRELRRGVSTVMSEALQPLKSSSRRYQLEDVAGTPQLVMSVPASWWKSSMTVQGPDGSARGTITQHVSQHAGSPPADGGPQQPRPGALSRGVRSVVDGVRQVGQIWFSLDVGDRRLGWIHADHYRDWDFAILDADQVEVARITKTWAGWAKERFTRADNYVLAIHRPLEDPLRSLVVAAALVIDVELKQGEQTHGGGFLGPPRRYE